MREKNLGQRLNKKCAMEIFPYMNDEICLSGQIRLDTHKQIKSTNGLNIVMELTISRLLKQHVRLGFAGCTALEYREKTCLDGKMVCILIHEGYPIHAVEVLSAFSRELLVNFSCGHIDAKRLEPKTPDTYSTKQNKKLYSEDHK